MPESITCNFCGKEHAAGVTTCDDCGGDSFSQGSGPSGEGTVSLEGSAAHLSTPKRESQAVTAGKTDTNPTITLVDPHGNALETPFEIIGDQAVIGRNDPSDIQIQGDFGVSGTHFQVRNRQLTGKFLEKDAPTNKRWYGSDLKTTNGSYVKVDRRTEFHFGQLMIAGGSLYRIGNIVGAPSAAQVESTIPRMSLPAQSKATVFRLDINCDVCEQWELRDRFSLGRGDAANITVDDEYLDDIHLTFEFHRESGRWYISDSDSLNGVWLEMIEEFRFEPAQESTFLIGSQRFCVRVP